jgi:hypothetical protein
MCVVALVVLLVAAVLLIPALARIVGAAVLILLVAAMVAAIAEPAPVPHVDAMTPTRQGWWVLAAEDRRPVPVPQTGAGCPSGYQSSPTSGTCSPSAGTRCRAFPSPTRSCPTGWTFSPTSNMCIESHC